VRNLVQLNLSKTQLFKFNFVSSFPSLALKLLDSFSTIIDTSYLDHSVEFYPAVRQEITKDLPPEKGSRDRMTAYVDADHAHDLVTRRSITGILVMLNDTAIR
jgi:hypothetical protein